MTRFPVLFVLLAAAGIGHAKLPEEQLYGPMFGELSRAQLRCEWMASKFAELDQTLSLYREDMRRLVVSVGGQRVHVRGKDPLLQVTFESRLLGPVTAIVAFDSNRLNSRVPLVEGAELTIGFEDSSKRVHPLFCGHLVTKRPGRSSNVSVIVAVQPRTGTELGKSRLFQNKRRVDALNDIANENGLQTEIEDDESRPVLSRFGQRNQSDWSFMRKLARDDGMDLRFDASGLLHSANSEFVAPTKLAINRTFTDMVWYEIIQTLANEDGRQTDINETESFPAITTRQFEPDLPFAHRLAAANNRSVFLTPGKFKILADGQWAANSAARTKRSFRSDSVAFARSIAKRHRLSLDTKLSSGTAAIVVQRGETDAELMYRVLAAQGLRLTTVKGRLQLAKSTGPGDVTDLVRLRATVFASGRTARRFTRSHSDVRKQLLDPEGVATTQIGLDLGRTMPATRPNDNAVGLAAVETIAKNLDATIAALQKKAGTNGYRSFLIDTAKAYRPSLIHVYRLLPDGESRLSALRPPPARIQRRTSPIKR